MWDNTGCRYRVRWSRPPLRCTMIISRSFRWHNRDRCNDLRGWMGLNMTQWSGHRWGGECEGMPSAPFFFVDMWSSSLEKEASIVLWFRVRDFGCKSKRGIQSIIRTSYSSLRNWFLVNLRTLHQESAIYAIMYLSRALVLSISCFKYTKSPTCRAGTSGCRSLGALDLALGRWFATRVWCWDDTMSLSENGSWSPVIWSRWVHISRADKPPCLRRELRLAVANANVNRDMGPPSGWTFNISAPSSSTTFSTTGLLLRVFSRPFSREMSNCPSVLRLKSATSPGAASIRILHVLPKGFSSAHRVPMASPKSGAVSLSHK